MRYRASLLALIVLALAFVAPAVRAQTANGLSTETIFSPVGSSTAAIALDAGLRLPSLTGETSAPAGNPLAAQETVNSGFGLAWAIMGLLVVSLLYALVAAVFAAVGRQVPALTGGFTTIIPVLTVVGLGVALYLTFVETQNVAAVCGPVGDCNAVQTSPFAKLFGFLPVGLLGAIGYVGILVAWALARRSEGTPGRLGSVAIFGMALFGVLFSIYLTYLELYIIRAVCMWCLTSAVIMSLVLVLSVGPSLEALQSEQAT